VVAVEARECMEALAEVRDRRAAANGSVLYVDNDEPSGDVGQGCGVSSGTSVLRATRMRPLKFEMIGNENNISAAILTGPLLSILCRSPNGDIGEHKTSGDAGALSAQPSCRTPCPPLPTCVCPLPGGEASPAKLRGLGGVGSEESAYLRLRRPISVCAAVSICKACWRLVHFVPRVSFDVEY